MKKKGIDEEARRYLMYRGYSQRYIVINLGTRFYARATCLVLLLQRMYMVILFVECDV